MRQFADSFCKANLGLQLPLSRRLSMLVIQLHRDFDKKRQASPSELFVKSFVAVFPTIPFPRFFLPKSRDHECTAR